MSILDFRQSEPVSCAGIPITTFLSDDRRLILVSATDLVEQLSLDVDLDIYDLDEYTMCRDDGRLEKHACITQDRINDFLYAHEASESQMDNLYDFRAYFCYEVLRFWERFKSSAASLSVRDAAKVLDKESISLIAGFELVPGRIFEITTDYLGYPKVPLKDKLSTIEYVTTSYVATLYAYIAEVYQEEGANPRRAMQLTDKKIRGPLESLCNLVRDI